MQKKILKALQINKIIKFVVQCFASDPFAWKHRNCWIFTPIDLIQLLHMHKIHFDFECYHFSFGSNMLFFSCIHSILLHRIWPVHTKFWFFLPQLNRKNHLFDYFALKTVVKCVNVQSVIATQVCVSKLILDSLRIVQRIEKNLWQNVW